MGGQNTEESTNQNHPLCTKGSILYIVLDSLFNYIMRYGLTGVDYLVLDEVHERSAKLEIILAYCRSLILHQREKGEPERIG